MNTDYGYKLNPAYCFYKGIAIERQRGSEISFLVSDKKVRKTIKKSFYDYVEHVRTLSECPSEFYRPAVVKFKICNKEEIGSAINLQIGKTYNSQQIEVLESLYKEKSGLVVIATESDSDNYFNYLHLRLQMDLGKDLYVESWREETKSSILKKILEDELIFIEMKKSTVADVVLELLKDNLISEEILVNSLKAIIVQDTHVFLEKEDLLSDVAVLSVKKHCKSFYDMTEEEIEGCFIHYTNFGDVLKNGMGRLFEKKGRAVSMKKAIAATLICMIFTACDCKGIKNQFINKKISNEFITACFSEKEDSLLEWQNSNRDKWKLDYVAWSRADDFLVDFADPPIKIPLYYGIWHKDDGLKGEVFSRSNKLSSITNDFSVPYRINGELDYSQMKMNFKFWFFNNCSKNIRTFTIVFYLFDQNGNPPVASRNNIVIKENMFVESYSNVSKKINLEDFFEIVPDDEYSLEYLYVSKIEFTDGTVWSDPFGMKYLN